MSFNVAIDGRQVPEKVPLQELWQRKKDLSMWTPEQCIVPWHCLC